MKLNVSMRRTLVQPGRFLRIANVFLWLWVIKILESLLVPDYMSLGFVVPQWLIALPGAEYQWNAEAARQSNVGLEILDFRDDYSSHYFNVDQSVFSVPQ